MTFFRICAAALFFPIAANAVTYTVDYDGPNIDLTGTIETSALGSFSASQFDASLTQFSITASFNGAANSIFTFTDGNSSFGGSFQGQQFGGLITVDVTPTTISINTLGTNLFDGSTVFLNADVLTDGALQNLTIIPGIFRFRSNSAANVAFETATVPFTLASAPAAIPLPASLPLLALSIGCLAALRRGRRSALPLSR